MPGVLGSQKGCPVLLNWELSVVTVWFLGSNPGSSERATRALTAKPSPAPGAEFYGFVCLVFFFFWFVLRYSLRQHTQASNALCSVKVVLKLPILPPRMMGL